MNKILTGAIMTVVVATIYSLIMVRMYGRVPVLALVAVAFLTGVYGILRPDKDKNKDKGDDN